MTSAIQKDIITLDITMDNVLSMKVGQTLASLGNSQHRSNPAQIFVHFVMNVPPRRLSQFDLPE
jgi:hypothetical protein